MKTTLTIFLIGFPLILSAQDLAGRWKGQLSGEGGSIPSILVLVQSGNTLSGSVTLTQNGASETYQLSGQANGDVASGTMILNAVALAFEIQKIDGQLVLTIGFAGQAFLRGQYARGNGSSPATPLARAQPQASGIAGQWEQVFRGRRLIYLHTRNGSSQKWYYDLCSNGAYAYRNVSGYLSGDFSQSFENSEQGTWRVILRGNVAYLECSPQNKTPYEKTIAPLAQGQVYLEGQRYFLDKNQSCQ